MNNYDLIKGGIERFYQVKNEPYKQDEYYKVYVELKYDDGYYYLNDRINVIIPRIKRVNTTTLFGNQREILRKGYDSASFTVYAKKTQNGIYEMVTGSEVNIGGDSWNLNCLGLCKVGNDEIERIYYTLKKVNDDYDYRNEYCKKLGELSEQARSTVEGYYQEIERRQKSKEDAIQYLKSYRI